MARRLTCPRKDPAREDVIDLPAFGKVFGSCMFLGVKFAPEGGALAPMATGENEELACHKIAGMGGHNVEKTSFGFSVSEGFQGIDVRWFDVHENRIWGNDQRGLGGRTDVAKRLPGNSSVGV